LIDLADEIAYNSADLDDAYSAGIFTIEEIAGAVPRYSEILGEIEIQFPGASNRIRFHEALRRLIDGLVSGLIEGTFEAAGRAGVETVSDVREYPQRLARFTSESQATSKALKQFLHRRVYDSRALVDEREKSTRKIADLFEFYVSDPRRLPESYREQVQEVPAHRVVCDYIAGMTERYFMRLYQQAFG
jgi:dGTPase